MCSSPGSHYYIIAHFLLGKDYTHKLLVLLLSIKYHLCLTVSFEKTPFFLLPVLILLYPRPVFIQRIYRRRKILYINIDWLIFSCRSCMWPLSLGESQSIAERFCQLQVLQGDASALGKGTEEHLGTFYRSLRYF